jgi:hypothetical protein
LAGPDNRAADSLCRAIPDNLFEKTKCCWREKKAPGPDSPGSFSFFQGERCRAEGDEEKAIGEENEKNRPYFRCPDNKAADSFCRAECPEPPSQWAMVNHALPVLSDQIAARTMLKLLRILDNCCEYLMQSAKSRRMV